MEFFVYHQGDVITAVAPARLSEMGEPVTIESDAFPALTSHVHSPSL